MEAFFNEHWLLFCFVNYVMSTKLSRNITASFWNFQHYLGNRKLIKNINIFHRQGASFTNSMKIVLHFPFSLTCISAKSFCFN